MLDVGEDSGAVVLQLGLGLTKFDFREKQCPAAMPCAKDLEHTSGILLHYYKGSHMRT